MLDRKIGQIYSLYHLCGLGNAFVGGMISVSGR